MNLLKKIIYQGNKIRVRILKDGRIHDDNHIIGYCDSVLEAQKELFDLGFVHKGDYWELEESFIKIQFRSSGIDVILKIKQEMFVAHNVKNIQDGLNSIIKDQLNYDSLEDFIDNFSLQ